MDLQRRWARATLHRLGIEVAVDDRSGVPRPRGVLFVHLNQQTLLAPLLYTMLLPLPCALVVNVEYAALPFLGWLSVAQRGVPIVRQRPSQAKAALARVARRLRAGTNFGISIEGRRTADGRLSPFKKGPIIVALEAQCDIVPFMTHGEYRLWPRGEWRIRQGKVDCVLYPAVRTRGLGLSDRHRLVEELRALAEGEDRRYATGS